MTVLVLGDQLVRRAGPLADDPERVLMVESREFAARKPYHAKKLVLVFSAMRHLRDALRDDGVTVRYEQADSFAEGFTAFFDDHPEETLTCMRPAGRNAAAALRETIADAGGDVEFVGNETFLSTPAAFDEWFDEIPKQEAFYRRMRERTGVLMDGGEPVGGEWNYDSENRDTPPDDYDYPEPVRFEPDALTRDVMDDVEATHETWGSVEGFDWPVTRGGALDALDDFVENRLADFGPYQDAIVEGEWAVNHALLAPAINLGLLGPMEAVEAAEAAYEERDDVPLNSVEGFVRQLLGWREFVRHVYRREPRLADENRLGATRDLPDVYWSGETDMACLGDAVEGVRERGYAHHIERLMVLSNFALTYGVDPGALNDWFHAGFVDAYHWVTTPNVVAMGVYGSDALATKPYAASANYVDRMSDHCAGCAFDPHATTGEGACPFNGLYWDFLAEHEDALRSNHRMGLVYAHLDDKRETGDLEAIRDRADVVRERVGDDAPW
ncbi:cryptochrome/photolyase family protein [Halocalculus aciditolerans]|uniref:Cryptochrome/photolyase family protein n=1 Tax=Halocalculus aciditolerans TaxID=1383812 RepID=A0A830FIY7_9EURY|nr:cryptochrome/photolyase family protein [Halocalculus aciditolerans]GGL60652.1 cryptochrome/photolyase family protein [Halocalculus aciditolerans]